MVLSAIVVTPTTSDSHVSTTSSRTHVPRLCGFHRYDLWRTPVVTQGVSKC